MKMEKRGPAMFACILAIALYCFAAPCVAATPEQIALGRQLFMEEFTPLPPGEQGDGLGPVFNHRSCVACHHAGGVGGAGDHRFNARTFSVRQLQYDGRRSGVSLQAAVAGVHPGLVDARGRVINSVPLHRHGGSHLFATVRRNTIVPVNPEWMDDTKINSDSVFAEATEQSLTDPTQSVNVKAHVFSRNTTALFGAGLIDQIPDAVLAHQVRIQQAHPEIHGRPATLANGRFGKFGWRANFATLVEFTENACVNELGLQSKNVAQPADFSQPNYRNAKIDIDNRSILAMTAFISALPAPSRQAPTSAEHAQEALLGESRFQSVGCAVCHVPKLGTVAGIYSDLLLHDMGKGLLDLNSAPPYRYRSQIELIPSGSPIALNKAAAEKAAEDAANAEAARFAQWQAAVAAYYGEVAEVAPQDDLLEEGSAIQLANGSRSRRTRSRELYFEAPAQPSRIKRDELQDNTFVDVQREGDALTGAAYGVVLRSDVLPTNFNQEWRTPPLWGLRDSAPYLHDGRAETVLEAIAMHGGETEKTRNRFFSLSYEDQAAVLAFLDTLAAPQSGVVTVPQDFTRYRSMKNTR
jgi:CxxC motif-containing protein (DUF1111 family)